MRGQKARNRYSPLSFASYTVIKGHTREAGRIPTGLYFNKMMSLLHSELKEECFDLKLPHCWYRWGDEVVRYRMPSALVWDHEEANITHVSWDGDVPHIGDAALSKSIKVHVSELTKEYSGDGKIDEAVNEVYAKAPFEFQRKYKACRDAFSDLKRANFYTTGYGPNYIWPKMVEAFKSFPKDDFPIVARSLPAMEELMKVVLHQPDPDYGCVNEISEEFWTWFCYYLRLHPKGHENVPDETLEVWREKLEWENERFHRMLGDRVLDIRERHPSIKKNNILGPIASERSRTSKQEDDIISSFEKDVEGLDSFLSQIKKGTRRNM